MGTYKVSQADPELPIWGYRCVPLCPAEFVSFKKDHFLLFIEASASGG